MGTNNKAMGGWVGSENDIYCPLPYPFHSENTVQRYYYNTALSSLFLLA